VIGPVLLSALLLAPCASNLRPCPPASFAESYVDFVALANGGREHTLATATTGLSNASVGNVQFIGNPRGVAVIGPHSDSVAEEPGAWLSHLAIGAYIASSFMDAMTTAHCLGAQRCNEANPALAPFQHSPLAFGLVKGIATAGVGYLLVRLHRGHPRLTQVVAAVLAAGSAYIAVRNVKTAER
jgi:hypothetical protein